MLTNKLQQNSISFFFFHQMHEEHTCWNLLLSLLENKAILLVISLDSHHIESLHITPILAIAKHKIVRVLFVFNHQQHIPPTSTKDSLVKPRSSLWSHRINSVNVRGVVLRFHHNRTVTLIDHGLKNALPYVVNVYNQS